MAVPLHILILEDSAFDAELEIDLLEDAGYTCQWDRVPSRKEFLAHLPPRCKAGYDRILADYTGSRTHDPGRPRHHE